MIKSRMVTMRMDPRLVDLATERAELEGFTFSGLVRRLLVEFVTSPEEVRKVG